MFDFSNLIVVFMAIAAFFNTDYPAALFFPGSSQKFITTPAVPQSQEAPTITQTIVSVLSQTATVTVVPPNNMLAIRTVPSAEPSLSNAVFALLSPIFSDVSSMVFTCLVGLLLLMDLIAFFKCSPSPSAINHEDLHQPEAQEPNKDDIIQEMRIAYAGAIETQHYQYRVKALELDIALTDRDQKIAELQQKLEQSENDIVQAWYANDDKIFKLEQKVTQLQDAKKSLDAKLDAAVEFVDGADKRIEAAEKSARVVAEQASNRVKAAEKATDEKLDRARKSCKDAISAERQKAMTAIDKLLDNAKAQQVKVNDMENELKQLAARTNMNIEVANIPSFVPKSTSSAAEDLRRLLQDIPIPAMHYSSATPIESSTPTTFMTAPSSSGAPASTHRTESQSKKSSVSIRIVSAAEPEATREPVQSSADINTLATRIKPGLIASTIPKPLAATATSEITTLATPAAVSPDLVSTVSAMRAFPAPAPAPATPASTTPAPTTSAPGAPGTPASLRSIPRRKTRDPGPFRGPAPTGKYKKP